MATTEFEGNGGEAEPKNACLNHECTFYFKKDGNSLEVGFPFSSCFHDMIWVGFKSWNT